MSDILLIGSTGFVGSNIANYLVQHSRYSISSIDDLSVNGHLQKLQPAISSKNRHSFYLAKAHDRDISQKIIDLETPKTVIYNLASNDIKSINAENQWQKTSTLTNWVSDSYLRGAEHFIILLNKTCLYSNLDMYQEEYLRICEEFATGLSAEKMSVSLVVPSYVFGPRESGDKEIANLMIELLKGEDPKAPEKVYDFIYIKDFYFALQSLIEGKTPPGFYELIGSESASLNRIKSYLKSLINAEPTDKIGRDRAKRVNPFTTVPSPLPWNQQYWLSQALEHTLCWYDGNRWAWEQ